MKVWIILVFVILLLGTVVFLVIGLNPLEAWSMFFFRSIGSWYSFTRVLDVTSVLTLTGLAFLIPFRAGLWNVGAEGQLLMGALASYSIVRIMGSFLGPLTLPVMILVGMVVGALWILPAAFLRIKWGSSEILVTLMLVYVAVNIVRHFVQYVWGNPSYAYPITSRLPSEAQFVSIGGGEFHIGFLFTVAALIGLMLFLSRRITGFSLRLAGEGEGLLRYTGVSVAKVTLIALLIGGAIAGAAGVHELAGSAPRLRDSIGHGLGFLGIPVALLAGGDIRKLPLAAFLFAVLYVGSQGLKVLGVPVGLGSMLIAGVVLAKLILVIPRGGR